MGPGRVDTLQGPCSRWVHPRDDVGGRVDEPEVVVPQEVGHPGGLPVGGDVHVQLAEAGQLRRPLERPRSGRAAPRPAGTERPSGNVVPEASIDAGPRSRPPRRRQQRPGPVTPTERSQVRCGHHGDQEAGAHQQGRVLRDPLPLPVGRPFGHEHRGVRHEAEHEQRNREPPERCRDALWRSRTQLRRRAAQVRRSTSTRCACPRGRGTGSTGRRAPRRGESQGNGQPATVPLRNRIVSGARSTSVGRRTNPTRRAATPWTTEQAATIRRTHVTEAVRHEQGRKEEERAKHEDMWVRRHEHGDQQTGGQDEPSSSRAGSAESTRAARQGRGRLPR